ncbi:AraC family transcriptional regulator [Paenibacillus guangzhouensis]|uniref:AraC family transcriptional regulator n=1 Tax=Paenibacillus guangzhouensis TaxID=1473112 RepID=UPI001D112601|nr:AraC family transcriptional regulator [Paenibacillus guangzhouensis]
MLPSNTVPPLHSLMFHLSKIEWMDKPVGWESMQLNANLHTLLIFTQGQGELAISDYSYYYSADKCYYVPPRTPCRIVNRYDSSVCVYRITFTAIQLHQGAPITFHGNLLPHRNELTAYPFSRLMRMVEMLGRMHEHHSEIELFHSQLRFQELVGFLFEHNLHADARPSSTQAVEKTIRYMHHHYMTNITVRQLAELAEISPWKYTPIFQELTGKKPLDFLTELRIKRSKELLLSTTAPLREIAHQVGFTDEYYFNRRFRQMTGIAPKQYATSMRRSTRIRDWTGHEVDVPAEPQRIIYYGETFGDLIALGIEAVGGIHQVTRHTLYAHLVREIQDTGCPLDLKTAMKLKPDLIIFANADEQQYARVSRIAPTVTFNTFAPLDQRLQTLGNILGKQREAAHWLEAYNAKAEAMWRMLQSDIRPGETATVLIYDHGNHLYVMGTSGFSSSLYHPYGFQAVDRVQAILDAGLGFAEIPPASLPDYAGDRIFMLLPSHPASRLAAEAMMASRLWQRLPAVQNGYVYTIEADSWNYGDAFTREKLLEVLPPILA